MASESERWPRIVLHVDMDMFYAAIEIRDNPELASKPVIVGGSGRRGVVSTCNYVARRYGVRSAMPGFKAHELCPHGVYLRPRIGYYAEVSSKLMAILDDFSPSVEPLSLDEAFLEMTGSERLFGTPAQMAEAIRARIRNELLLTASVGVAANKFIAKIASDVNKPDGLAICPPGSETSFLHPLPIERIWGVGKKAATRLHAMGLRTIGDVAAYPEGVLQKRFGGFGTHIWHLAHGRDRREVNANRGRKSIGAERTLADDIVGVDAVRARLRPLTDEVARTLRRKGKRAWGVRLKIKYSTFQQVTRDVHLEQAICDSESIREALEELMTRVDLNAPMRLVGLATYDLIDEEAPQQMGLFAKEERRSRQERLEQALDAVGERFGDGLVVRGASLNGEAAERAKEKENRRE